MGAKMRHQDDKRIIYIGCQFLHVEIRHCFDLVDYQPIIKERRVRIYTESWNDITEIFNTIAEQKYKDEIAEFIDSIKIEHQID
jgi:hypothetical protein